MEEVLPKGDETFFDSNSKKITKDMKKNPWMIVSGVLGAIILISAFLMLSGVTGGAINSKNAGQEMVDFLNSKTNGGVSLVDVEKEGIFYKVTVSYQSQEIPVYMTKDGKYFVQGIEEMAIVGDVDGADATETPQATQVPKTAKPIVELFIMTHCPYGTQAEKGIIPVIKEIATKADITIRFVHYFMHGDKEETETYNQLCIREEQGAKYLDYLTCFLEAGDTEGCLTKAKIDKTKLTACTSSDKAEKYYQEDSDLSKGYGVQGSPTLIINGVQSNAGRSSASYLKGICDAFTTAPDSCSKQLSSTSPSAGFGYGESQTNSQAQC